MADIEQSADSVRPPHADRLSNRLVDCSEDNIEKLGRQRPLVFKNAFTEIGFCCSILASNLVSVRDPLGAPPRPMTRGL